MRDHGNWSLSLGSWGGVYVRLHMFFLLFAAGTLYLSWLDGRNAPDQSLSWMAWVSLAILLTSVLLHELGHLAAALRLGGGADELVLWPLGGLAPMRLPGDPHAEFVTSLAGPVMNLAICGAVCFPILLLQPDDGGIWGLMSPFTPTLAAQGTVLTVLQLTFWINWMLFVLNMTPAYPFDGGRVLRSALLMFWTGLERRAAAGLAALVAKCGAVSLVVAAILIYPRESTGPLPPWFALLVLAIFIYFSAKQEENQDESRDDEQTPFGYDFSQGYTSLERSVDPPAAPPISPLSRWLQSRRDRRQARQREIEQEEERRVDEILARLHEVGIDNLAPEERSLLQRVSARYRSRQSKS